MKHLLSLEIVPVVHSLGLGRQLPPSPRTPQFMKPHARGETPYSRCHTPAFCCPVCHTVCQTVPVVSHHSSRRVNTSFSSHSAQSISGLSAVVGGLSACPRQPISESIPAVHPKSEKISTRDYQKIPLDKTLKETFCQKKQALPQRLLRSIHLVALAAQTI